MIAFISLCYGAFYILFFNKLKLFDKTPKNISIFIGLGVVLVGAIVFSWWTVAPPRHRCPRVRPIGAAPTARFPGSTQQSRSWACS